MRGLSPIDQDLPAICLVQGGNEQGKSGFLDSILYLWENGHDDGMMTIGADKAEVIATMEDGLQLRALLAKGETKRMTKKPGASKWSTSRAEIDALVNGINFNPLEFVGMKPKEQLALLLNVRPIEMSEEEVAAAVCGAWPGHASVPRGLDPLSTVEAMRKILYDERTGKNREADGQSKHATELEKAIGPAAESPKDLDKEVLAVETELDGLTRRKTERFSDIRFAFEDAKEKARLTMEAAVETARGVANDAAEALNNELDPRIAILTGALAIAKDHARQAATQEGTRKAIEVARQSAAKLKSDSDAMTTAIENLDKLQATVAGRLDLPVRFVDGVIHNESGVAFEKWNDATKVLFSLKLAIMMKPNFVVIDRGLEKLDPPHQRAFLERAQELAAEDGTQFFVASITADPKLSIGEVDG